MPRFRKKSAEAEAVKVEEILAHRRLPSSTPLPEWVVDAFNPGSKTHGHGMNTVCCVTQLSGYDEGINVDTPHGVVFAAPDCWLIRDVDGDLYPCTPSLFEATYEPVEIDGVTRDHPQGF